MRTRTLVVAMVFGLLAACTTSQGAVAYRKSGAAAADRQQDENACLRSSIGLDNEGYVLLPFEIDGPAYRHCMEAHGYVAEPVAPPPSSRP